MSWISDLAGKAEAFLERVDQATASTIQNVHSPSHDVPDHSKDNLDSHIGELQKINLATKDAESAELSTSVLQSMVSTQPKPPKDLAQVGRVTPVKYFTPGKSTQWPAPPTGSVALNEDSWLEYLNTPLNKQNVRAVDADAVVWKESQGGSVRDEPVNRSESDTPSKDIPVVIVTDEVDSDDITAHVDHMITTGDSTQQEERLSNIEQENSLLRGEVKRLSSELAELNKRLKEVQEATARHKHEVMLAKEQLERKEHLLQHMRGQEEDLKATLDSKTSQLVAIKALLEGTQAALEQEREKSRLAMVENERLVRDAGQSSGLQAQAMDSLQEKLRQLQSSIDYEKSAFVQAKNEFDHKERRLTHQLQVTSDALRNNEAQLKQLQGKYSELLDNLKSCQAELQLARQEHLDYKQRATSILQCKEKLIADLRDGQQDNGEGDEAVLEQVRMDKLLVEQQLSNTKQQLEHLRAEMMEMETCSTTQLGHVTSQLKQVEEALIKEKHGHNETRALLHHTKEESLHNNEEMVQYKIMSLAQLNEKEQEIQKLQEKLSAMTKSPSHGDQAELEARLQELTESLINKQTTVETLSSERNSLQLQLDRAKSELSQMEQSHKSIITHHHNAVSIAGLDGASAVPQLHPISVMVPNNTMTSSSMKSSLSHSVRRAASSLDVVSIRLGVLLRRYPYARLFLLGYGVLLHLWVMIVLLTYSPEVHQLDPHS